MTIEVRTELPGNIWKILVEVGSRVEAEQPLFIMEVMKTEVAHVSPAAGEVVEIRITEGQEGMDADEVAIVIGD